MARKSGVIGFLIGFLSKLILLLVLLAAGAGVWGVMEEPKQLRYTPVKMRTAQWPLHWQPVTVVAITDLHMGSPFVDIAKLQQIVELVNKAEPDMVLLIGGFMPGDYFKTDISPAEFAPVLGKIEAEFGVFALLGRHDVVDGGKALADALKAQEIKVLSNSAAPIKLAQKKRIWLVGFEDDPASYEKAMSQVAKGEPAIGMVHNPARFPDIPAKVDVVFAGYTLGGLVTVPEYPMPILPAGVPKRYAYGHIREDTREMFVSAGVGTHQYPIRLNNKPEIVVATILPSQ